MNMEKKIKKWCLLENGTIERCYYNNGELRDIYKDKKGNWYLDHDVYAHQMILYVHSKIVKFADTVEELQNDRD